MSHFKEFKTRFQENFKNLTQDEALHNMSLDKLQATLNEMN